MFNNGMSPTEIAVNRGLAQTTVDGHLARAIKAGERLEFGRLVDPNKRSAIEAAFANLGTARLRPIMDYLGDGYNYPEVRYVSAAIEWTDHLSQFGDRLAPMNGT